MATKTARKSSARPSAMSSIMGETNRIADAVDSTQAMILARGLDLEKIVSLSRSLNIDINEYIVFQEKKSLAHASGVLTLNEANYVFGVLGSGPDDFNRQPLPVKVTITKLMAELMAK
jgi:hypothetical protein